MNRSFNEQRDTLRKRSSATSGETTFSGFGGRLASSANAGVAHPSCRLRLSEATVFCEKSEDRSTSARRGAQFAPLARQVRGRNGRRPVGRRQVELSVRAYTMSADAGVFGTLATRLFLDRQLDFWLREVDPVLSLSEVRARITDISEEPPDT